MLFPDTAPTNPFGVGRSVRLDSGEQGTVVGLMGDAHVHLGLIDPRVLPASGIGRVTDVGWSTHEVQRLAQSVPGLEVDFVGNFLAAEGGYPSDRSWAPADATVFVSDAQEAVRAQIETGACAIKITLNSDAGPVHNDEILAALVDSTLRVGLTPIIHAEGAGQAQRAIRAVKVVLAHTPFTEVLSEELITYAAQNNVGWMSTLDIHGYGNYGEAFEIACENLRHFVAAGGTVFYGTDLGNGPLPVGINQRELRALHNCGLDAQALLESTTAWWDERYPLLLGAPERWSFISEISDTSCEDFASWLATARIVEHNTLEFL